MKFIVSKEIFDSFPDFCVAVITAEGIDNREPVEDIKKILEKNVYEAHEKLQEGSLKERKEISAWRESFRSIGINPNKFPSSIEALLKRISKKPEFPSINNIVDLVNSVAVKNMVPMGAHDIDKMEGNIHIRLSREGDLFTPFGSSEQEPVPPGEPVYADDIEVRTRIWTWRQGENAKITPDSTRIFFPIDGFKNLTLDNVLSARDELKEKLETYLKCRCRAYFVDAETPRAELEA